MKVGTIVTATDTNPLYMDFVPIFIKAWSALVPEADIRIVLVAESIPEQLQELSKHLVLFPPIPGIHTAFQAQCIRLLYPREVTRDEGVLITDMDMLPMNRRYYVDSITGYSADSFVVYRDVCLPSEISMCYNIAHPSVWKEIFGDKSSQETLVEWHAPVYYDGQHGGHGWNTDQLILVNKFNQWGGSKVILNDSITEFRRLDRVLPFQFQDRQALRGLIKSGYYADYHCLRPYSQNKEMNDFIVDSLSDTKIQAFSFCLFGPENPRYYTGLIENVELVQKHFPGWKVFVYYAPDVTHSIVEKLNQYPHVVMRPTNVTGYENTIHRFFAIDEENVEIMIVRDADSRVHWKDRWAIREFLKHPEFTTHAIRDNAQHSVPLLAGLWGLRKSSGLHIRTLFEGFKYPPTMVLPRNYDQTFLAYVVHPLIQNSLLVHYSNSRALAGEHAVKFPFEWTDDVFCGKVESGFIDTPEPPIKKSVFQGTVVNFLNKK